MRKFRGIVLSLVGGIVGALLFAAPAAWAQTTVSTFTIQVSGTAPAVKTGLPETVAFSGPVVITSTVVTDPTLPPGAVVQIDGRGVIGTGNKTGTTYKNELEANLTRPFAATDTVNTTFAFFKDAVGSYLASKTGLLTLNLTYDTTTMALTNVTGTIGSP
ncbi:MAG: hypothetical protein ACJ79H_11325 [Myxococcales bacterium]